MIEGFAECHGCGRHVRAADHVCPFCQTIITAVPQAIADAPGSRASRAAILAGALLAAACQAHDPTPAPIYGGPPEEESPVDRAEAAVDPVPVAGADAAPGTPRHSETLDAALAQPSHRAPGAPAR